MTSATTAQAVHEHHAPYAIPAKILNGTEMAKCHCGTLVVRQVRPDGGPDTRFIPRDWDEAHAEALIEDAQRAALARVPLPAMDCAFRDDPGHATTHLLECVPAHRRELLHERFGPLPTEVIVPVLSERETAIDALRGMADFLEAHPDVPAPYAITAYVDVESRDQLLELAGQFGVTPYGPDERKQFSVDSRIWGARRSCAYFLISDRPRDRAL